MTELLQMAQSNNSDKTKLQLVNGASRLIEWLPIHPHYVIGSHFIPAGGCYGFHFVKCFFPLNLCSPPPLFLLSIFCLCTCWRLKRSRRAGALLNVAGPRSSPFPLANMDLCAQDSVFSASLGFSSCFSPHDLSPLHLNPQDLSRVQITSDAVCFPGHSH